MRARTSSSAPAGGSGADAPATNSAMARPPRRPNTTMSSRELVPSRLAPCTDTQAHSPAAYRPGKVVPAPSTTTSALMLVGMPPMA